MNKHKFCYIISYTLLLAVVATSVCQTLLSSSQSVTFGKKIASLEKQKQQLHEEMQQLHMQIRARQSLAQLHQEASNQGFVTATAKTIIQADQSAVASR